MLSTGDASDKRLLNKVALLPARRAERPPRKGLPSAEGIEPQMQSDEVGKLQRELEKSLARYTDLYHNAPVGYLTLTENGFVSDINRNAADLLGAAGALLLRRPFVPFVCRDSVPDYFRHKHLVLHSGSKQSCDLMLRKRNGAGKFWAHLESVAHEVDGRKVMHIVITDVTAGKAMEEELRSNEERLRLAKNAARIGIYDNDLLAGTTDWDERVREIWGVDADVTVTGDILLAGVHPDDRDRVISCIDEALASPKEGIFQNEYRVVNLRDKVERWVRTTGSLLFDSGRPVRFVGTVEDITYRKHIEDELRRSRDELEQRVRERTEAALEALLDLSRERKRFYDVLEALPAMISLLTPDYHVVFSNRAFRERYGEPDGRRCYEYRRGRSEPCDACEALEPFDTGRPHHWTHASPEGDIVFDAYDFPFTDADGSPLVLQMNIDITEQVRLEEQLRQSQKMQAIGALAGGIAHDFNNMLAVIIGNAELALEDVGDDQAGYFIRQIVKASRRARDLIRQILTFSRKSETGRESINLTPLVKETFELLRGTLPSTIRMKLHVRTSLDTVVTDPSQVQQAIMNLATNAAHAMQEKGGVLTIELSGCVIAEEALPDAEMKPGPYVKLVVRDTGTGMTEEVRQRIFEPFFTTKEVGRGTGMGLAVVYGVAKSGGGTVTVETAPGKGSAFSLFLPIVSAEAKEKPEKSGVVATPRGSERILLVDDEQEIIETTSRMLERLGYRVTTALSGSEAWRIFSRDRDAFDLVITDQTMPDLTGIDLARKMLRERGNLPIILFTGFSETVTPEKARSIGVREYLMKPPAKQEMAEIVRRVLDKRQ